MSKKVRYAVGALGALPALGLLTPQATAAATTAAHAHGKTVRTDLVHQRAVAPDAHCVANSYSPHSKTKSSVHLKFWTKPGPAKTTCIGTIEVSAPGATSVSEYVSNHNGHFCSDRTNNGTTKLTFVCRDYFQNLSLGVRAFAWYEGAFYGSVWCEANSCTPPLIIR
jgi:hypothetical protein